MAPPGKRHLLIAEIHQVAEQLENTSVTLGAIAVRYHVGKDTLREKLLAIMTPEKYAEIGAAKKAQNMKMNRQSSKILKGAALQKHQQVGTISMRIRRRRFGLNGQSERTKADLYIKYRDGHGAYNWMRLAVHNWIKANKKLVPHGFSIMCKNGDTTDCSPENLILVKQQEAPLLNMKNFPGMSQRAIETTHIKMRNDPLIKQKRIKSYKNTCRVRREAKVLLDKQKADEQTVANLLGSYIYICVWECTNCSAEYEQESAPYKCVKCGRSSFEKNLYRRQMDNTEVLVRANVKLQKLKSKTA